MGITTGYGTWVNYGDGMTTVEGNVVAALGDFGNDYDVPAVVVAYRAAINDALPTDIELCGSEFYGPAPVRDGAAAEIRDAILSVDFFAIAARHEYTRPDTRYWITIIGDTAAVASYIRDTAAAAGVDRESVDHDRSLIEFGQQVYNVLAALPASADGHIDTDGWFWYDGTESAVGRL